jgi:hypothetical protein
MRIHLHEHNLLLMKILRRKQRPLPGDKMSVASWPLDATPVLSTFILSFVAYLRQATISGDDWKKRILRGNAPSGTELNVA